MVGSGIYVINPDGVGAESLHERSVKLALHVVHQRVVLDELVCDAWSGLARGVMRDSQALTFDEELRAVTGEELGAFRVYG